jgi:hypothetical protein
MLGTSKAAAARGARRSMTITSRTPWQKIATADLITCAEGPVGGDRDYLMQLTQQLDRAWAPWTRPRAGRRIG